MLMKPSKSQLFTVYICSYTYQFTNTKEKVQKDTFQLLSTVATIIEGEGSGEEGKGDFLFSIPIV